VHARLQVSKYNGYDLQGGPAKVRPTYNFSWPTLYATLGSTQIHVRTDSFWPFKDLWLIVRLKLKLVFL